MSERSVGSGQGRNNGTNNNPRNNGSRNTMTRQNNFSGDRNERENNTNENINNPRNQSGSRHSLARVSNFSTFPSQEETVKQLHMNTNVPKFDQEEQPVANNTTVSPTFHYTELNEVEKYDNDKDEQSPSSPTRLSTAYNCPPSFHPNNSRRHKCEPQYDNQERSSDSSYHSTCGDPRNCSACKEYTKIPSTYFQENDPTKPKQIAKRKETRNNPPYFENKKIASAYRENKPEHRAGYTPPPPCPRISEERTTLNYNGACEKQITTREQPRNYPLCFEHKKIASTSRKNEPENSANYPRTYEDRTKYNYNGACEKQITALEQPQNYPPCFTNNKNNNFPSTSREYESEYRASYTPPPPCPKISEERIKLYYNDACEKHITKREEPRKYPLCFEDKEIASTSRESELENSANCPRTYEDRTKYNYNGACEIQVTTREEPRKYPLCFEDKEIPSTSRKNEPEHSANYPRASDDRTKYNYNGACEKQKTAREEPRNYPQLCFENKNFASACKEDKPETSCPRISDERTKCPLHSNSYEDAAEMPRERRFPYNQKHENEESRSHFNSRLPEEKPHCSRKFPVSRDTYEDLQNASSYILHVYKREIAVYNVSNDDKAQNEVIDCTQPNEPSTSRAQNRPPPNDENYRPREVPYGCSPPTQPTQRQQYYDARDEQNSSRQQFVPNNSFNTSQCPAASRRQQMADNGRQNYEFSHCGCGEEYQGGNVSYRANNQEDQQQYHDCGCQVYEYDINYMNTTRGEGYGCGAQAYRNHQIDQLNRSRRGDNEKFLPAATSSNQITKETQTLFYKDRGTNTEDDAGQEKNCFCTEIYQQERNNYHNEENLRRISVSNKQETEQIIYPPATKPGDDKALQQSQKKRKSTRTLFLKEETQEEGDLADKSVDPMATVSTSITDMKTKKVVTSEKNVQANIIPKSTDVVQPSPYRRNYPDQGRQSQADSGKNRQRQSEAGEYSKSESELPSRPPDSQRKRSEMILDNEREKQMTQRTDHPRVKSFLLPNRSSTHTAQIEEQNLPAPPESVQEDPSSESDEHLKRFSFRRLSLPYLKKQWCKPNRRNTN